jgi:hypothetical protein
MIFYVIEHDNTMHYISIFMFIPFNSWLITRHAYIIFLYPYPLLIKKTFNSYLNLNNIGSKFVFSNICIHICIRFFNMKIDME